MNDVQVLAAVVNERRGKLYRTVNGSREPLYSASIMAEKLAEIAAFERAELERIVAAPGLSKDTFEQASKSLG